MTTRRPCPPAPGPLEGYVQQFDPLLASVAQRRGLRDYLQGLLLPRDRNKTLTALADAEPITGAQHREVQRLQWFLSESTWDHEAVNQRRIELLCADAATAPHAQGVLVIDDTGDRKDGNATAHVARQYLGSVGKTDNGIVAVTSLWADARCYWPLDLVPYTPASRLAKGKSDPEFRTKPQLAAELVGAAQQAGIPFRAVVADCFYGDNTGFVEALGAARVGFVLALKPRKGTWAPDDAAHTPVEAARELGWAGPGRPGPWRRVTRRFRDGHAETWWAADAKLGGWGPDRHHRLVVATTDPATLPKGSTWYLLTNLAGPAARRPRQAQLAEIVGPMGCVTGWSRRQAGQGRARLGRLPGPQRPGDPPALDAGVLRVQLLLARRPDPGSASRRARTACSHPSVAVSGVGRRAGDRAGGPATSRSRPRLRRWPASGVVAAGTTAGARLAGPWVWLRRCWRGWSASPPPLPLQQALDWVRAGRPINLYLPP